MLLPWPITVIYHQPAQAHLQGHRHENTQLALMDHHGANPGPPCAWMIYLSSAIAVDQVTCHNGQAQTQYLLLFHCLLKHWLKHLEGKAVLGVLLWLNEIHVNRIRRFHMQMICFDYTVGKGSTAGYLFWLALSLNIYKFIHFSVIMYIKIKNPKPNNPRLTLKARMIRTASQQTQKTMCHLDVETFR